MTDPNALLTPEDPDIQDLEALHPDWPDSSLLDLLEQAWREYIAARTSVDEYRRIAEQVVAEANAKLQEANQEATKKLGGLEFVCKKVAIEPSEIPKMIETDQWGIGTRLKDGE